MARADEGLEARAAAGEPGAQIALGLQWEAKGNNQQARAWFARAVKSDDIVAMRLLGRSLFTKAPMVMAHAVAMLRTAAERGDAEAQHFCALLAALDQGLPNRWRIAQDWSARAAQQGFAVACGETALLNGLRGDIDALAQAVPMRMVRDAPRIGVIESFAPPEICDWFSVRAQPKLQRAAVYDAMTGRGVPDERRSNRAAEFDKSDADLVQLLVQARIAATVGTPGIEMESTSILHYAPGQEFSPHFDFLDATQLGYARDIAARGQRVATFLLYLNDDYEGGETEFPEAGFRYKGRKGDALLFWNVDPGGRPDGKSLHAGVPVTRGEKWVLSQWLRRRV